MTWSAQALVCDIIRDHRSYLLDELHQMQSGTPRHIFSTNIDEDITKTKDYLDAFTKVLEYLTGN